MILPITLLRFQKNMNTTHKAIGPPNRDEPLISGWACVRVCVWLLCRVHIYIFIYHISLFSFFSRVAFLFILWFRINLGESFSCTKNEKQQLPNSESVTTALDFCTIKIYCNNDNKLLNPHIIVTERESSLYNSRFLLNLIANYQNLLQQIKSYNQSSIINVLKAIAPRGEDACIGSSHDATASLTRWFARF